MCKGASIRRLLQSLDRLVQANRVRHSRRKQSRMRTMRPPWARSAGEGDTDRCHHGHPCSKLLKVGSFCAVREFLLKGVDGWLKFPRLEKVCHQLSLPPPTLQNEISIPENSLGGRADLRQRTPVLCREVAQIRSLAVRALELPPLSLKAACRLSSRFGG